MEEAGIRAGLLELPRETWDARLLDDVPPAEMRAGRFVEIGRYEGAGLAGATAVAVLPEEPVQRRDLALDPGRWLRGAGGPALA